ncbi:MAG: crossover junction endodeoxyribonuclease RuvC [Syntrophomonadaceae bacterium]|nr:crossover junction endodeoxyribonuclease RuvC [Syntrophomonadaceae bacterium]
MLVLGIDPGTARMGYGLVQYLDGKIKLINYGLITTSSSMTVAERLLKINDQLQLLIEDNRPDAVAVEQLFYNKNAKTIITVAESRGVAIMTAARAKIEVAEYTPLQVKQAVVGFGNADKRQVQEMVKRILSMDQLPKPDDAADAIAIAICHLHSYKIAYWQKGV